MRCLLPAIVAAAACRGSDPPAQPRELTPPRRVLGPATGGARAQPPHAIRVDGVGPYRIGRPMSEILADLLTMVTVDIPGVVSTSVVRAEDGGVLIEGDQRGDASFVAVVRPDIARTESSIMVGSSKTELETALGPVAFDRRLARDPREWVGRQLPGVRFLVEQDRVVAVMIGRGPAAIAKSQAPSPDAGVGQPESPACSAPAAADAIAAAAPKQGAAATASAWCPSEDIALTVVATGDAVVLFAGGDRLHRIGSLDAPGVAWAAPIAGPDNAGDDLAVVSERAGGDARVLEVAIFRWEGGHPVKIADQDLYRLTAATSRWIGARIEDVELVIELEARGDDVVAGGALLSRERGEIHDLAPLQPVTIARGAEPAPADLDAGHPPPDDARR